MNTVRLDHRTVRGTAKVIECLDTPTVAVLARLNRSTLDYWVRTELVQPSLRDAPGRRRTRLWTVRDAVIVRAIAQLRAAGCPLQRVRQAKAKITKTWGRLGSDATLVWNGHDDILQVDHEGAVESLLRYPGQQLFRSVALPISVWTRETKGSVKFIHRDLVGSAAPSLTRADAMKRAAGLGRH